MKRAALLIAIAAILIPACQHATPTPTSTGVQLNASTPTFTPPPPPDTPAPVTTSTSTDAIDLQIAIQGQAPDPLSHLLIDAGASLTIRIDSVSVTYIEYVEQPSFLTSYEIRPSASSPVTEMQFCVSLEAPCELTDQWTPFYPHQEVVFPADWLGRRTLNINASFRDAGGNNVLYFVSVQYRDANGNVSPVYCDDISVEGMPPPPRP